MAQHDVDGTGPLAVAAQVVQVGVDGAQPVREPRLGEPVHRRLQQGPGDVDDGDRVAGPRQGQGVRPVAAPDVDDPQRSGQVRHRAGGGRGDEGVPQPPPGLVLPRPPLLRAAAEDVGAGVAVSHGVRA